MRTSAGLPGLATAALVGVGVAAAQCGSSNAGSSGPGVSVLEYHANGRRDGVIIDPAITLANAPTMHIDPNFNGVIDGAVYAQPLYVDGLGQRPDMVLVATETNQVFALDAASGIVLWSRKVGADLILSQLPCGSIDPYGITGTPVVDLKSRRIFLDAVTSPDGGQTVKHLIFALSIDDGTIVAGWPVDVDLAVTTPSTAFQSKYQNQRGALTIVGDQVFVPYGGLAGDCGTYHGWVVGVSIGDPTKVTSWATPANGGGIWAPGGVASDGSRVYVATGNTFAMDQWAGGEAVLSFATDLTFTNDPKDYWAPTDWKLLDTDDADLGSSSPILFDLPDSTPSQFALALGKDGHAYLMDRTNLGGVAAPVAEVFVIDSSIIGGATLYNTDQGVFYALRGECLNGKGMLGAGSISPGAPPTTAVAWCADQHGNGSPFTTTSDGLHDVIVWAMGSEGDNRLHGFDGRTGTVVFDGGGPGDLMDNVRRWATPIAAKGRIFAGATDHVYAFTSE